MFWCLQRPYPFQIASAFILRRHQARFQNDDSSIKNWETNSRPDPDQWLTCNVQEPDFTYNPNEEKMMRAQSMPNSCKKAGNTTDIACICKIMELLELVSASCSPRSAKRVDRILHPEDIGIPVFRVKIKNIIHSIAKMSSEDHISLPKDEFERMRMDDSDARNSKGFMFWEDIKCVYQGQMEHANHDKPFWFFPEHGVPLQEVQRTLVTCAHHTFYISINRRSTASWVLLNTLFCQDCRPVFGASFVVIWQLYSDRTTFALKANALIAYLFSALFIYFSPRWCSGLINNRHPVVSFLPAGNVRSRESLVGNEVTTIPGFTSSWSLEVESSVALVTHASSTFQNI